MTARSKCKNMTYLPANTNVSCGIYRIVNKRNGKFYIGSTKNADQRKREHWYRLKRNNHHCFYLQNAWNKEPDKTVFVFEMFIYCKESLLENIEQGCLDFMKPHYNICDTAGRIKFTDAVLQRLSDSIRAWWSNIPQEERPKYAKVWWENMSPEEKEYQSQLNKQKAVNWWGNASDEEKAAHGNAVSLAYERKSETEKIKFAEACRAAQMSKTPEQRSKSAKKSAETRRRNKLALLAEAQNPSDWPSEDYPPQNRELR